MDVSHPIRSAIPSLDGPVLNVLAGTTHPLTTLDVHRLAGVGSSNGVRLVLERLTQQGLALADHRRNAVYYTANRDHVAWPAVEILAGLRRTTIERITAEIASWSVPAIHASLFGSFARADGDADSDIDILLVGPRGEAWDDQVDRLRTSVLLLTGNRCQAYDVTPERLREHVLASDPLVRSWLTDSVLLYGEHLSTMVQAIKPKVFV